MSTNEILKPITPDGLVGYDGYNQLQVVWEEEPGRRISSPCFHDVRGKTCPICGLGWVLSSAGFRDQYLERATNRLVHERCWVGHLELTEAAMWYTLLCDCRPKEPLITWEWLPIPNEYGGGWKTSWYRVFVGNGSCEMKLGRRKRVWHMSLHGVTWAQCDLAAELLKDENVTKWINPPRIPPGDCGEAGIHAWTREKAREYMTVFYKVILGT